MNRLALAWVDVALGLEQESRELRALVLVLAVALARERELADFARDEIAARFPEDGP